MNVIAPRALRSLTLTAIAAGCLAASGLAHSANHALIMTINYAGTDAALPGIDADGEMGVKIAAGMGVPQSNIRWVRNSALGLAGMTAAIQDLSSNRIAEGDKVFIYYSGHGTQTRARGTGAKCTEGMVSADLQTYSDDRLEAALNTLANKASQVVMLNDSCFSGGQATKTLDRGTGDGSVPKVYYPEKTGSASDADYECNQPVNKTGLSRTLGIIPLKRSTRMLYVAASADNEVSWAGRNGSTATVAWASCLSSGAADRDGNGIIDGDELRQCAQSKIDSAGGKSQTITVVGEGKLPVSFTAASGGGNTSVGNAAQALETLRKAADPTIPVDFSITKTRLKIDQDLLDFSVRTAQAGYLYLLHVGTDGKFYQLFPNSKESNNYLNPGSHRFPRPSWGIQAQGPAGTGYFMAYLSTTPRNFAKDMEQDGAFASASPTRSAVGKLAVVALDGRFGASPVATIEEFK